ncbi:glycosyltransferase family 2 protein [Crystallibacter degradans]|uniref:glycosyltransferase family 2 protein n=1 Tax=Crystallibacter degradans TaxID=2726743 RepID=UPI00147312C9|nr:glycosyltransferase [Arthrobacter sp. SF27]NMR31275.1 glycosyltransferase [Arthrobacter sp. SF27]
MAIRDRLAALRRDVRRPAFAHMANVNGDSGPSGSAATAEVSVIVPVYNAMPYLTELLNSLEAQDLDPSLFELIAVDDGSTDFSGEILDVYAARNKNFRVIHQENSGWPGKPRNVGMAASQAQYVFFCDADDRLGPQALRRMIDFAIENNVDVLVPKMVGIGGRRVQAALFERTVKDVDLREILRSLSPQKMVRRELLVKNGIRFHEDKVRLEDGMVMSQCYLLSHRTSILADYDYYYIRTREDGANISSTPTIPEGYTWSVGEIARILTEGDKDAGQAKLLVLDLFRRKCLRVYEPQRFLKFSSEIQQRWMAAHADFVDRYIPEDLEAQLVTPFKQKTQFIRNRDVAGMLEYCKLEGSLQPTARATGIAFSASGVAMEVSLEHGDMDTIDLLVRSRDGGIERSFRMLRVDNQLSQFRAELPYSQLDDFPSAIVDFFTEASSRGMTGKLQRVTVDEQLDLPEQRDHRRPYATIHGSLSLDLRR